MFLIIGSWIDSVQIWKYAERVNLELYYLDSLWVICELFEPIGIEDLHVGHFTDQNNKMLHMMCYFPNITSKSLGLWYRTFYELAKGKKALVYFSTLNWQF